MNSHDRLLTQAQVAEIVSMSEAWLEQCRFRRTGIDFIKVGRSVRYRMSDVLNWLDQQKIVCD